MSCWRTSSSMARDASLTLGAWPCHHAGMNAQPRGIPLRPDLPPRPRPATHIERACYAAALSAVDPYQHGSPEHIAKARWGDGVTELVLRAASAPLDRTN